MATINRVYNAPPTIKAFMHSDAYMRMIMGPIGSGKSSACCVEIIRRCKMQEPGPDGIRRSRWVVIRNTAPQLKDTTLNTWFDWAPPGRAGKWVASDKKFILKFGDVEAEILFRPLDTPDDISRVLSLELTGAWLNECREIPKEIVEAVQGRIGRYPSMANGGPSWHGMICDTNPPEEDSWWHHHMTDELPDNAEAFFQPSGLSEHAENKENLIEGYYENWCIGKSQEQINIYVHGKFARSMAGKPVYLKTFTDALHVGRDIKADDSKIVIGMDFGLTPAAILTQMQASTLCLLEEVVAFDMGLERFMDTKLLPLLRRKYPDNEIIIVGDPSGKNRSDTDESTAFKMLKQQYRMDAVGATTNVPSARISAVEYYLTMLMDGKGALQIDPVRCPWSYAGFRSKYMYRKKRGASEQYADKPDKNDWSHIHDAIQYACLYWKEGYLTHSRRARAGDMWGFEDDIGYAPQACN